MNLGDLSFLKKERCVKNIKEKPIRISGRATTIDITRLINVLDERIFVSSGKGELSFREFGITNHTDAIAFLLKFQLVKRYRFNGKFFYYLSDKEKEFFKLNKSLIRSISGVPKL